MGRGSAERDALLPARARITPARPDLPFIDAVRVAGRLALCLIVRPPDMASGLYGRDPEHFRATLWRLREGIAVALEDTRTARPTRVPCLLAPSGLGADCCAAAERCAHGSLALSAPFDAAASELLTRPVSASRSEVAETWVSGADLSLIRVGAPGGARLLLPRRRNPLRTGAGEGCEYCGSAACLVPELARGPVLEDPLRYLLGLSAGAFQDVRLRWTKRGHAAFSLLRHIAGQTLEVCVIRRAEARDIDVKVLLVAGGAEPLELDSVQLLADTCTCGEHRTGSACAHPEGAWVFLRTHAPELVDNGDGFGRLQQRLLQTCPGVYRPCLNRGEHIRHGVTEGCDARCRRCSAPRAEHR